MPSGTGTHIFQKKWPERFFDVGIAEAHAVTFAAGLATQGVRPVVAIYSTFLQRAYDIDHPRRRDPEAAGDLLRSTARAWSGEDGQTHMGLYDIAYMLAVPHMTVTAPKDGAELIGLLRCALAHKDGPFSIRYPRDKAPAEAPPAAEVPPVSVRHVGAAAQGEGLRHPGGRRDVQAGARRRRSCSPPMGLDVTVVNARFLKPMDREMLEALARDHQLLVTVEDGTVVNGFGAALAALGADDRARRARRGARRPRPHLRARPARAAARRRRSHR